MFAVLTDNEKVLIVAIFIFCLAGLLSFVKDETASIVYRALIAFGLAVFALGFIVNP